MQVLCNIQVFAKAMPSLFVPHFEDFFVNSSDSYQVKALKLEILSSIATYSSISAIFLEFQDYIRDQDRRFAADTVAAIGLCSQRLPDVAKTCLEGLLALALSESSNKNGPSADEEAVLVQAINSIKTIIKQDPPSHEKVYFPYFLLCWSIFMHASDDIYLNLNFPDILSLSHKMCSSKKICNVINSM
ncbi:AP3-complex subunit beta-A-like [Olea europaea var. sylvestris]|uniref:AP3-complex subunit beta-A-like n=1 Tax=Olea europaea var. sylvestris TaxID=158386 RepID=UPI000C1D4704|nr:AP3-complex subunit beta-A-like [Olea europaea var. sylvestris]